MHMVNCKASMATMIFELHLCSDQGNHVSSETNVGVDCCLDALSEKL